MVGRSTESPMNPALNSSQLWLVLPSPLQPLALLVHGID